VLILAADAATRRQASSRVVIGRQVHHVTEGTSWQSDRSIRQRGSSPHTGQQAESHFGGVIAITGQPVHEHGFLAQHASRQ
jgi:hypothetical protein